MSGNMAILNSKDIPTRLRFGGHDIHLRRDPSGAIEVVEDQVISFLLSADSTDAQRHLSPRSKLRYVLRADGGVLISNL